MTSFAAVIVQVVLLDIVFSIDSILTAVGMTDHVPIMVVAVIADQADVDGGKEREDGGLDEAERKRLEAIVTSQRLPPKIVEMIFGA